jgi:hypothetical protein
MKPTRWNLAERQTVAERAAQLLKNQGIAAMPSSSDRVGGSMVVSAINRAQELLPPDRHRHIASRQEAGKSFVSLIADLIKSREFGSDTPFAATPTPPVFSSPGPLVWAKGAFVAPDVPVAPTPAPLPSLGEFTIVELMSEFARRIDGMTTSLSQIQSSIASLAVMQEMQVDELAKIRDATWSKIAELNQSAAVSAPRTKKPRVAILGCRKYEFDHIVAGFGSDAAEFKHYDQDTSPHKITADYAISLKWLNHSWDAQIKSAVPSDHYRFLNGGTSTAIQQLKTWFP